MSALVVARSVVVACLVVVGACSAPGAAHPANRPPEIEKACAVAERKCTACHDRERWAEASHTPEEWRDVVDEMRLLPGSGITIADSEDVLRCLGYRSDGVLRTSSR